MIRWVNYSRENFAFQYEVEKSVTIIDKINQYIHDHYDKISEEMKLQKNFSNSDYLCKVI